MKFIDVSHAKNLQAQKQQPVSVVSVSMKETTLLIILDHSLQSWLFVTAETKLYLIGAFFAANIKEKVNSFSLKLTKKYSPNSLKKFNSYCIFTLGYKIYLKICMTKPKRRKCLGQPFYILLFNSVIRAIPIKLFLVDYSNLHISSIILLSLRNKKIKTYSISCSNAINQQFLVVC